MLVQYDKNEFQLTGNNFLEYIQYQIRFCIVETIFCLLDTILCIIKNNFVRDIVNNFLADRNHCVLAYVRKLQLVKTFPRLVEPTFLHMETFFWLVKTNLSSAEVSMQFPATVFRLIDTFTLSVETFLLLVILYVMHFILAIKTLENIPRNIYLFKVNNKNTRKRCKIYSKLTIKTSEQCH